MDEASVWKAKRSAGLIAFPLPLLEREIDSVANDLGLRVAACGGLLSELGVPRGVHSDHDDHDLLPVVGAHSDIRV
jgi:hypothetical protein